MEAKGRVSRSEWKVNCANWHEELAWSQRMKPGGSDDEVTRHLWKNNFIRMAGAEIRFQEPKESAEDIDSLNVVVFFQEVFQ